MLKIVICFSLLGLLGTSAQIIQDGQCNPDISLQANFNIDNFLGFWYEVSRTDNPQQMGECSRLSLTNEDGVISINYENVNRNFYEELTGTVIQEGATPKLSLNLNGFSEPVNFWVLMTDHNTYAVTYHCVNINANQRAVYIWQLGRAQTFSELFLALMNTSLNNLLGITLNQLRSTNFSEDACYELPVIDENQPIVLPGQCDQNIPVVESLDVERFTGLWHEISSYYSESALGTCARAEYTLAGGVVNVVNSQVVNQGLDTITGTATVIDADGRGKLSVTLEVAPGVFVDQELWVLATDYTDYAILYSCLDLDNQKRVFSWITSRTRVQTEAAKVVVTEVVDSIMELNTMYYEPTDQSDDGCFYYPEHVADTPVVFRGSCDMNIPAMANFDAQRYMGLWHEIASYPSVHQTGTCNNAQYTLDTDLGVVDVFNTQVIDERLDTIRGNATIADYADGTGKLVVTFPITGTEFTVSTNYWVLDTDYDSYAIVYTCENLSSDTRGVWSWKLSRSKQLSTEANTAINAVIATIPVLDERYYQTRDQSATGCFYYPVPEAGVPVVFPGQCDDGIAAFPNFNLNSFQGVWHEIESYPENEQSGDCRNHFFTQGTGNSLDLQSSQIVDQFLTVSTGSVAVTSSDGSARLVITIVSDGQVIEIPYWILNTDYTDHALAYACVNLNSDYRAIWSWKLSRTKQLSASANAAIDQAISNIDVLGNEYYVPVDQSDLGCFYLPELEPGEPVVIVGQCQADIPVVQNFDAGRFAGHWRLIENYPVDSSTGTCEDVIYTVEDQYLRVVHTQVIGERLHDSHGFANLVAIGNEGKILVTYPGADPVEYWVLDTDYDEFAILYACENIDSEWRRVWSWKMSRTTALTTEAVTAINQIIDSIDVLNNRYFQPVDNSDAGCFYYPYADGNPVVFRGTCDDSIPVVTGFDVNRYMGLWYDIESYPQEFQDGTCATATYTLIPENVEPVEVYNTQVINETLDYIYGTAVPDNDDGLAKLLVTFPVAEFIITSPYWVLDTDYDNYAIVYACVNLIGHSRRVSSWKLSRQKTMSAASQTAITAVIDRVQVLSHEYFVNRDHTDDGCFYYPVPEEGKPVVFPGQCDENIQAESDFDLNRFSGLWHEIAAYPKEEQEGQCVNYEFTAATTDSFSLYTTSVIGLLLDETNATVTRTSTDNSAKFTITITSGGTTVSIPYWIISTDYDNHALAYSCVNLNENYRGVWSWKLSRDRQMPPASETALTEAMALINVLDNRYFETTSQSDESCFYLPNLGPEDPVVFRGQCDQSIPVVSNFDPTRYEGRWRLIQSYQSDFQTGTCNDATYTLQEDLSVLVVNTQVIAERLDSITGSAALATTDGSGKLLVTFPGAEEPVEYWILDTDYDSYALVYSCMNLNSNERRVWSWKMSRTTALTTEAVTAINQIIDSIDVLNNRYFQPVDNSDAGCFYYPYADGNPVVFRGTCDDSIPVVTGFDVNRYMGLWYDIESYPQEFQDGTCATATYTLIPENVEPVEVYNTQVINETLDYIYGTAVPDNDDGLAKLLVTFPVAEFIITSPYWVLDTDYDNYAIVYACVNLIGHSRRVSSWKLSRQKTMSAASQTAINAVIDRVQVLSHEYFVNRDHTNDGCFYYPVPEEGKPVVFPGQCDENIQAERDFDLNRFSGLWHEIAAYPKEEQEGQCVNYEFTAATTDSFSLSTTSVIGLLLDETNATVTRTSTDNSAKFTITITSGGTTVSIPYWIISTDYDNHALAYSCVNLNENYRGVWSWKLSRDRQMPPASETALTEAMAPINVLDNRYFETTSQSDESCFYLPSLGPEDPVVFRGQCDQSIPVVSNFDPTRYEGRWRLIQSYQSDFQTGTCNDATYTLQEDLSVLVVNTQVIAERLDSITGSAALATADGSGKLLVTFPGAEEPVEYWILDTDYVSYALVYSCMNLNSNERRVWSWKMSRDSSISSEANTNMDRIVNSINVLDQQYYQPNDQSDTACFYFPVPDGRPVLFRGQCDQSVSVVTDFDVQRYSGLWYDVESYPQQFQDGTCSTATYTLNEEGVVVYNTQVVNETLDFIYGTAVLDNDENLAKLIVSFPIAGTDLVTNSPYWVLTTDYDSHALVYSCVNESPESRRVSSWKLSREKTLNAASMTAINAAISNVQVLADEYYTYRDHTDEGCFYFPEVTGRPVRFRGQCDETIQAVPDFELNRFSGLWHETAAYPKDQQEGQCVNYDFELTSANTLGLYTTQVIDLVLDETNATVVQTATDNSARFTITINTGDSVIEIPYWILATNYDSYAVAYSCWNIDPNYREVHSWKLSRDKLMSEESEAAIRDAISGIQVLDERYYETTSQSDESCFYLPVLAPEDPVVFVGQCDPNIQVIQNFDPTRYEGRWRLIQSYFSEFQGGTCNDATFTIQGDGSVLVYNTQVVNEELDTITGSAVLATADGTGKLLVTFPGAPEPVEYWILDTDYETYALVYSCRNLNSDQRQVWSWKLSRTTTLPEAAIAAIDLIIDSVNVLDGRYYSSMDHSAAGCFYFPVPDGNPVLFRGVCDDSIRVVQNFDVERYMGTWYDIESYPQAFQDGTCATATYALTDDGVSVFNTQVVEQLLDNVNATARPASDDGLAKLIVTFPVAGTDLTVDAPYWVLDTDYDGHALVYSCSQINEEYRSVTSWKLSRSRQLTQAAQTAINAVINTVQVLGNQYYNERGHSEEQCFYYPDNFGGPVLLDGQCEAQNAVENFNLNLFAGTWHETARFPSNEQTGECATSQFVINQNSFVLTQTIVHNERLTTVSGPAVVASDGSGIITATLQNDDGVSFEMTLYVLDTDYTEYALLFSCMEIDGITKQIYSWKLSRSRSGLSQAANERIDELVTNNIDLHEIYYEYTDQSNDGCFHYPVFDETPEAIVLPGPCDGRIQAKANFDVNSYLGRWFEVSKYPQRDQVGECSRAHYNPGQGDAPIDVRNTIVYNQQLETREGTAVLHSTDGSGLLWVTFDLGDGVLVETNYYVLETDYDSFALVYSCRDLDSGDSEVYSWKLSRQPTLTDAANSIINSVISNTRGLLEEYYVPTSQSDEDCFYVPELNENAALHFRGQCESVSGVEGFDLTRYLGWWHEIERFPTDGNPGDCTSSQYTSVGNAFQVVDTRVFDLTGEITTGTVVASNNGVLTRTLSNGQVEVMVVLATDYETYSLLYTCSNTEDGEYRRVWSAKHSKSQTLTEAAQNAMAPIIDANKVLYPQFYLTVDQSHTACFHYPEPTGEKVILPGQCDDNIPAVTTFNPVEYTGEWYLIEHYPYSDISADSTCIGARYTYNSETEEIGVTNWQVVDGDLSSVHGTARAEGAKMIITMPIAETNDTATTEYYILQTDYTTHSLVYTCSNVNQFQREVVAFKLSRTRSLPASAVTAINTYMASREELHQPYFTAVEQDDDCPDPSSALLVQGSFVVLLVCAVLQILV